MFTQGLGALSSMTAVTLNGSSRGGRLPAVCPDDSHYLVDANELIVTREESEGILGVDRREAERESKR